jgi:hypothetical protein
MQNKLNMLISIRLFYMLLLTYVRFDFDVSKNASDF